MPLLFDITRLVIGFVLLMKGADWLIHGSGVIARRLGVSPLVIGLTVVAFGTSAPELAASLGAVAEGKLDIPIGNVVGSNIANVGLILGMVALFAPFPCESSVVRKDVLIMLGVTLVGIWLLSDARITRLEAGALAAGLAGFVSWTYLASKGDPEGFGNEVVREAEREFTPGPIGPAALFAVGGAIGLAAGSWLLVGGAVGIAGVLGVPQYIIALVLLAIGTSIPELFATFAAVRKGEPDLAVGNVLGSNVFNLLAVLGITGLFSDLVAPAAALSRDLMVMGGAALVCVPFLAIGRRLTRWEGGALLLGYTAYIVFVSTR
ncbi:MAG: calcium/sodium antiporter [Planctomycetota bacterium]